MGYPASAGESANLARCSPAFHRVHRLGRKVNSWSRHLFAGSVLDFVAYRVLVATLPCLFFTQAWQKVVGIGTIRSSLLSFESGGEIAGDARHCTSRASS